MDDVAPAGCGPVDRRSRWIRRSIHEICERRLLNVYGLGKENECFIFSFFLKPSIKKFAHKSRTNKRFRFRKGFLRLTFARFARSIKWFSVAQINAAEVTGFQWIYIHQKDQEGIFVWFLSFLASFSFLFFSVSAMPSSHAIQGSDQKIKPKVFIILIDLPLFLYHPLHFPLSFYKTLFKIHIVQDWIEVFIKFASCRRGVTYQGEREREREM